MEGSWRRGVVLELGKQVQKGEGGVEMVVRSPQGWHPSGMRWEGGRSVSDFQGYRYAQPLAKSWHPCGMRQAVVRKVAAIGEFGAPFEGTQR